MIRRLAPAAVTALCLVTGSTLLAGAHAAEPPFNAFVEDPAGDTVMVEAGDGSTPEDVHEQADLLGLRVKDGYSESHEVGLLQASWKVASLSAGRRHAQGEKQVFLADLFYTYTKPGSDPEERQGLLKVTLGKGRSWTILATGGKRGGLCRAASDDPLASTEFVGWEYFKPSRTVRLEFFDWCVSGQPERVTQLAIAPRMLAKAPSPAGVVVDEDNATIKVPDAAFGE